MIGLFSGMGVDMYFDGEASEEKIDAVDISSTLEQGEIATVIKACMR